MNLIIADNYCTAVLRLKSIAFKID